MQLEQPPDEVKLLLIGNSSVGKTSLLLRFSDSRWFPEEEAIATTGIDVKVSIGFPVTLFANTLYT